MRRVPGWVWVVAGVNVLMGIANIITFAVTQFWDLEPIAMFRLSDEANIPTWWSSAQLLVIGLLLAVLAWRLVQRREPGAWVMWLPALLFIFLSMDEVASIHETIGHRWGLEFLRTGMWVGIVVPVFLVMLTCITWAIWPFLRGRTGVIRTYAAGIGLLLFSAVGLELLANLYPDGSLQVHTLVLMEEVGEMMAGTLMLWATAQWVASFGLRFMVTESTLRIDRRRKAKSEYVESVSSAAVVRA